MPPLVGAILVSHFGASFFSVHFRFCSDDVDDDVDVSFFGVDVLQRTANLCAPWLRLRAECCDINLPLSMEQRDNIIQHSEASLLYLYY